MRLLSYFARQYPWQSLVVVLCLTAAAVVEGIGLSTLLPLLNMATQTSAANAGQLVGYESEIEMMVRSGLGWVGLEATIGCLLSVIVLAALLKAALVILSQVQVGYTVAQVATDLRLALLRALLSTRWDYYTRQPVGAAANAIATEADRASQAYYYLAQFVALGFQVVLYVGFAIAFSWKAALGAAVAGGFVVWILSALVRMAERAGQRQTKLLKSLLSQLTDSLGVVKLLKATGREGLIGPLLEHDTGRLNRQLRRRVFSKSALRALQPAILISFIAAAVYVALTQMNIQHSSVLVLVLLIWHTLLSISKMQQRYQSAIMEASALWSLREMIERVEDAKEAGGGPVAPALERGIALQRIRVEYDGALVLDDLALEIPAGQITAIVGPSGAGKTTIVDLITGLVQPQNGTVLIDGVPLGQLQTGRWRALIGYVPQEMLLLHDTIHMNVTLGDPAISDTQVEEALRDAGAWPFVSALPEGLDASVGERGTLFSGGQRQRIAIARALVHQPRLLILDEATSGLDAESERAVWATVERLRGRTTVVAISHQSALVDVADRVYRIDGGHALTVPSRPHRASAGQEVA